jgi:hypothetical protein
VSKVRISGLLSDLSDSFSFSLYLSLFLCSFLFLSVVRKREELFPFFGLFCSLFFRKLSHHHHHRAVKSSSGVQVFLVMHIFLDAPPKRNFSEFGARVTRRGKRNRTCQKITPRLILINITHTLSLTLSLSLSLCRKETRNTPAPISSDDDFDGSVLVVLRINTLKKW